MEQGRLVRWAKAVGEKVAEGELLAEIETDKATMDMESMAKGVILELLVAPGAMIPVNTAIAFIGQPGEDLTKAKAEAAGGAAPSGAAPSGEPAGAGSAGAGSAAVGSAGGGGEERQIVTPVARRIAQDHGLDLKNVEGSGPGGRIIKRDVEAALAAKAAAPAKAPAPVASLLPSAPPPPTVAPSRSAVVMLEGSQRVELTPMRRAIAARMTESWTSAPLFALKTEVDMDAAVALRDQLNAALAQAEAGYKLSFNDLVIKACALALQKVPAMNVAWGGDHVVQHKVAHIGVAVAIEGGLITPVVRDADRKGLGAIAQEVKALATRARDRKLKPEEFTGSTFSISNLGMYGVTSFQAVINPPEAGILAVGALVRKPVVNAAGALAVGHRMEVNLSCDHRSTDGAVGATFLAEVKRLLENPVLLTV
jgi:pyruvate dehydrogenase E2 component (dihydrolipoamide acetyltransferase)